MYRLFVPEHMIHQRWEHRGYLFSRPRVKVVIPDTNGSSSEEDTSVNTNKLILLSESVADAGTSLVYDEV